MKCKADNSPSGRKHARGCGVSALEVDPSDVEQLKKSVTKALAGQGVKISSSALTRFANQLSESVRNRRAVARIYSRLADTGDIIWLIRQSRDDGDLDEAIWRAFLATHFGRTSLRDEVRIFSATRFLFSFGDQPFWTWDRVNKNREAFKDWLFSEQEKLATLKFGNHRKYESPKSENIRRTIESFIRLAEEYGSPSGLIQLEPKQQDGFDVLYRRLRPIWRFGRTGNFDFLELLHDLKLIKHEAAKCYLRGSTGPKKGAKLLWGDLPISELEQKAVELAEGLGVSKFVMEDCLCNWQK